MLPHPARNRTNPQLTPPGAVTTTARRAHTPPRHGQAPTTDHADHRTCETRVRLRPAELSALLRRARPAAGGGVGDGPVRLPGLAVRAASTAVGPGGGGAAGAAGCGAGDDEPADRRGAWAVRVRGAGRGAGRQSGSGGPPVQRGAGGAPREADPDLGGGSGSEPSPA